MNYHDIIKIISSTIKTAVDETCRKLRFDRSFLSKVSKVISPDTYQITYCGQTYAVSSASPCSVGDIVRVCAPGNDFSKLYITKNHSRTIFIRELEAFDGKNSRGPVIRVYDDGDDNNYGSEMIMGAAGNLYIGSGESAYNLYKAQGTSTSELLYVSSDGSIGFFPGCQTIANRKTAWLSASALYPAANGGFTLGTSSLRWGQIYSTASSISTSDRNQKHDIAKLSPELCEKLINGLNPVSYMYNNGTSSRKHWGLIAQDVEQLLKELGIDSKDFAGYIRSTKQAINPKTGELTDVLDETGNPKYEYGLRYEEFIAPIIQTIQLQSERIAQLEERISQLENSRELLK